MSTFMIMKHLHLSNSYGGCQTAHGNALQQVSRPADSTSSQNGPSWRFPCLCKWLQVSELRSEATVDPTARWAGVWSPGQLLASPWISTEEGRGRKSRKDFQVATPQLKNRAPKCSASLLSLPPWEGAASHWRFWQRSPQTRGRA